MHQFTNKVLRTIAEKEIAPKPKWHFLLRNYAIWSLLIISIIIGTVSVGIMIALLTNYDLDIYGYLGRSPLENDLMAIPYFWITILLLTVWLIYRNYRVVGRGYRHNMYTVVVLTMLLNILGGTILFVSGFSPLVDNFLLNRLPFYNELIKSPTSDWSLPDHGLLGGKIISVGNAGAFSLAGLDGKIWRIQQTASTTRPNDWQPKIGLAVKLIGQERNDQIFEVRILRPWNNATF